MRKSAAKTYSLSSNLRSIILILLLVVVVGFATSYVSLRAIREQNTQYLQNTSDLYLNQVSETFDSVNNFLITLLLEDDHVPEFVDPSDYGAYYTAAQALDQRIQKFFNTCGENYSFFLYTKKTADFFLGGGYHFDSYAQYQLLRDQVEGYIRGKSEFLGSAWDILPCADENYLIRVYEYGGLCAGAVIPAENLLDPLRNIDLGPEGFPVLMNQSDRPITSIARYESLSNTVFPGSRLIIPGELKNGSFSVKLVVDSYGNYEKILVFQLLIVGLAFLAATGLLLVVIYLSRRVIRPVKFFTDTLSNLGNGQEDVELSSNILELNQANTLFHDLMGQVKRLKINLYEQELERQRVQMEYMQLQIKPHFFLNCLNCIYGMAQNRQYREIQGITLSTSRYFRYIFQSSGDFVPLEGEINHVRDYLDIQKIRYGELMVYRFHISADLSGVDIPPLILQTFVENSVRHSVTLDDPALLQIEVTEENPSQGLRIIISDNGSGFDHDILGVLSRGDRLPPENGHHIGIANAMLRLDMLYRGAAKIEFENLAQKGARVTIHIPVNLPEPPSEERSRDT